MQRQSLEIINQLGLHARAAAKLVGVASQFSSSITIAKDGREVDAKSIMSVMMLAAACGSRVDLSADGSDEQEAMEALTALINDKFGEGQ